MKDKNHSHDSGFVCAAATSSPSAVTVSSTSRHGDPNDSMLLSQPEQRWVIKLSQLLRDDNILFVIVFCFFFQGKRRVWGGDCTAFTPQGVSS